MLFSFSLEVLSSSSLLSYSLQWISFLVWCKEDGKMVFGNISSISGLIRVKCNLLSSYIYLFMKIWNCIPLNIVAIFQSSVEKVSNIDIFQGVISKLKFQTHCTHSWSCSWSKIVFQMNLIYIPALVMVVYFCGISPLEITLCPFNPVLYFH